MKNIYPCICLIIGTLFFSYEKCAAQIDCEDFAVLVTASVDTITPSVTLNWDVNPLAVGYVIYRKTKTSTSWKLYKSGLSATARQFVDTGVVVDSAYEYWVHRNVDTSWVSSNGYIYVSVKLHATEYRGDVILLVDSTYRDSFATQLMRLKYDLIGDGWIVIRHDVSPTDSVNKIRTLIKADYNTDPANVLSVFIFGHVPVPYSGDIAPDGHTDHVGAWPADGIYGDMTGTYTDTINYDTAGIILANQNIAGDGKYDQSTFTPGNIKLEVGRVDLSNMDSFALSEPNLLIQYLNKDHAFRQKQFTAAGQGIINDNFGVFDYPSLGDYEAFASCGWRSFAPLLGSNNITAGAYFSSLNPPQSYLWSYGCGGGDFTGASGVGSTPNFAHDTVNTVFTMLFGSYFGDWNVQNNFLRAPLASQPMALSSCWGGRPNWTFHFMGSGETLGFCARWAQNNDGGTYYAGYGATQVHIALMGDPTLTMHIVAPAADLQLVLTDSNTKVALRWSPSPDTLRGYYVYRSPVLNGQYTRIASLAPNDTAYLDTLPLVGNDYYMVRALKLISSPSGYYFNLSEGVFDSTENVLSGINQLAINNRLSIYPNPASNQLTIVSHQLSIQKIEITNALGQVMFASASGNLGVKQVIDVSTLAQGIYFVSVTSDNETVTRKVTVVR